MIREVVQSFTNGIQYVRNHPQLLLTVLLIVVIPIAFLFSGQQFLSASRDNLERLEHDRIGLLHDAFLPVVQISLPNYGKIQKEIERLAELNPDIVAFRVAKKADEGYIPIAALNTEVVGVFEPDDRAYNLAFTRPEESLVTDLYVDGERFVRGVRFTETNPDDYVILTVTSRASADALFASRIQTAYYWLFIVLAIVMVLVIRHIRLIDYSYLYRQEKRASEAKDVFTNMVAHELRAPLTAMRGYASMIHENESVDSAVREQARRIDTASERLVVIVNDLLDVARIQTGKLSVSKEEVDLSDIVLSVTETLRVKAEEKHIALSCEGTGSPVIIISDEKRLYQVVTNLVSNAIKYTPKGSIAVSLEMKRDRVELRVKDTGMGIEAENQKKLFAPFYRVESDDVLRITGSGLGMWITKQLIELLGGSIGVESIKGVGTHIVVTIPTSNT